MIAVDDIAARLREQAESVARAYCSPAGAYVERGQFYALNPGRADRHVGSFFVTLRGAYAGRWRDMATGEHGDMLDLIRLALGTDMAGAVAEAKRFLGIEDRPDAEARARLAERRRAMEAEAARRRAEETDAHERRRAAAFRLWSEARPIAPGDPGWRYLEARGVDLSRLPRPPRALRVAAACGWRQVDPETGEVLEGRGPALVTAIAGATGRFAAAHRIWLAERDDGRWVKHPRLREPKKVLGGFRGGCARLWRGVGPDGRLGPSLADAPAGSRAVLCEGIEDGLAIACLRPDLRVLAAVSLSNMGQVALPEAIGELIVAADNDEGRAAREALERAVAALARPGRLVRLWRSPVGKDAADLIAATRGAA